jgi:hypothetical protein
MSVVVDQAVRRTDRGVARWCCTNHGVARWCCSHPVNERKGRRKMATYPSYPEVPHDGGFSPKSGPVRDVIEKRLIEALERVEAPGDVAPFHVHDPMTMLLLRENTIQAHLMRWDDFRGRAELHGHRQKPRSR